MFHRLHVATELEGKQIFFNFFFFPKTDIIRVKLRLTSEFLGLVHKDTQDSWLIL